MRQARRCPTWDGVEVASLPERWGVPCVEAFTVIGSTNDRARELLRGGAARGTVVVSDEQSGGRGRRGRAWVSPPNAGLWLSVVLSRADAAPQLALLVGTVCAGAIEALAPKLRVGIKWPNDLIIRGRKVGGILCESSDAGVVVGIGVNVSEPRATQPSYALPPHATTLETEASKPLWRMPLADRIVPGLLAALDGPEPLARLAGALQERDVLRGHCVETEQVGPGVAVGIDSDGALLVERSDGSRVRVVSGSANRRD